MPKARSQKPVDIEGIERRLRTHLVATAIASARIALMSGMDRAAHMAWAGQAFDAAKRHSFLRPMPAKRRKKAGG